MKFSTLAALGASVIGASALGSFGTRLGRDAYKNIGNILIYAVLVIVGFGPFVLTYFAASRLASWTPLEGAEFLFKFLLKWLALLLIGAALLYGVAFLVWIFAYDGNPHTFYQPQSQQAILKITHPLVMFPFFIGTIVGVSRRKKQQAAYAAMLFNQNFLDAHGFQELGGGKITHIDGDGNRLRMINQGRGIIEFMSLDGRHAFITIGPDGHFMSYAGPDA